MSKVIRPIPFRDASCVKFRPRYFLKDGSRKREPAQRNAFCFVGCDTSHNVARSWIARKYFSGFGVKLFLVCV